MKFHIPGLNAIRNWLSRVGEPSFIRNIDAQVRYRIEKKRGGPHVRVDLARNVMSDEVNSISVGNAIHANMVKRLAELDVAAIVRRDIIDLDMSKVEARIAATLAPGTMKHDLYTMTAARVFQVGEDDVTGYQRAWTKERALRYIYNGDANLPAMLAPQWATLIAARIRFEHRAELDQMEHANG